MKVGLVFSETPCISQISGQIDRERGQLTITAREFLMSVTKTKSMKFE